MSKTYYKVVHRHKKQLMNWNHHGNPSLIQSSIRVVYEPNKWITPPYPGSRLFVFDSLDDARYYCGTGSTTEYWECQIKGAIKYKGCWMDDVFLQQTPKEKKYWQLLNQQLATKKKFDAIEMDRIMRISGVDLSHVPAILTKAVKLTKKLYIP